MRFDDLDEAVHVQHFAFLLGIECLGQAVGIGHERIADLQRKRRVFGDMANIFKEIQPDAIRVNQLACAGRLPMHDEIEMRSGMDEDAVSKIFHRDEGHEMVFLEPLMHVLIQNVIRHVHDFFRGIIQMPDHCGMNGLRHHHNQPRRDAMPGHVADSEPQIPAFAEQNVIEIAADFIRRKHFGLDFQFVMLHFFGEQRGLNPLRQFHFFFQALFFFAFADVHLQFAPHAIELFRQDLQFIVGGHMHLRI